MDKKGNFPRKLTGREKYEKRAERHRPTRLRDMGQWIVECDESLSKRLSEVAEDICKGEGAKIIRLIGPTCSGKTTAANMLMKRFADLGKNLHTISIDDFYFDTRTLHQISEEKGSAEIDYDSPDTIDLAALKNFIREIFDNDRSHCPIFDFTKGQRTGYREYECGDDDIFLFEGIQVLYPCVSDIFADVGHPTVEIYIAPQSSISIGGSVFSPNEIRLMRRIVRDRNFRSSEADFTFSLWGGVRRNEEKNIFPYVGECKYSIDSTMPYEIGVLKPYLISALECIKKDSPYANEANTILERVANVLPIDSALVPEDSIYKEFV